MKIDARVLDDLRPAVSPLDPVWSREALARVMTPVTESSPVGQRPSRRRVVAAAAATAAASVGVVLAVPGLGPSAAWSVSEGNAGAVHVEVRRLEDAAGLEAALGAKGVRAEVTYLPHGQRCTRALAEVDRGGLGTSVGSDHSFAVTLAPGTIRAGETLVIEASLRDIAPEPTPDASGVRSLGGVEVDQRVEVVQGDPGPCDPA